MPKIRMKEGCSMEIERKWMVKGWPEGLPLREEFAMRQGYILSLIHISSTALMTAARNTRNCRFSMGVSPGSSRFSWVVDMDQLLSLIHI